MEISNKMYNDLKIYDTEHLEKYLQAIIDEINSRSVNFIVDLIYTKNAL